MRVKFVYPWESPKGETHKAGSTADLPAGVVAGIVNSGFGVRVDDAETKQAAKPATKKEG